MTEQIAIDAPEVELTGEEIVEDAAGHLAAELAKSCDLTGLCAYRGYSGKIMAELQLEDFDTSNIIATVTVGNLDPAHQPEHFEIGIPAAKPSVVRQRSGLATPSLDKFESAQTSPVTTAILCSHSNQEEQGEIATIPEFSAQNAPRVQGTHR